MLYCLNKYVCHFYISLQYEEEKLLMYGIINDVRNIKTV